MSRIEAEWVSIVVEVFTQSRM